MAAQSPTTIRQVPGDQVPTDRREAQRRAATQDGARAAQANQRALGSAASIREARGPARPRPNSPAHAPGERSS